MFWLIICVMLIAMSIEGWNTYHCKNPPEVRPRVIALPNFQIIVGVGVISEWALPVVLWIKFGAQYAVLGIIISLLLPAVGALAIEVLVGAAVSAATREDEEKNTIKQKDVQMNVHDPKEKTNVVNHADEKYYVFTCPVCGETRKAIRSSTVYCAQCRKDYVVKK